MTEGAILIGLDLSVASRETIEILLEDAMGPEVVREIYDKNSNRIEILKLLMESPGTPPDIREEVRKHLSLPVAAGDKPKHADEGRRENLLLKLQHLTVGEKIAIALRGGRDIRTILLKDSNKEVVLTVLKNPKITETEVELIAHSRNIAEEALRSIHKNREWMKNYSISLALVNNPKTPPGIGITLVTGLKTKDIVLLEKNKNISEGIRAVAKKVLQVRKTH
jgi:hypothetical protein